MEEAAFQITRGNKTGKEFSIILTASGLRVQEDTTLVSPAKSATKFTTISSIDEKYTHNSPELDPSILAEIL